MMRRSYFITSIAAVAVLLCGAAAVSAQTGQLRGHVLLKQADGTTIKAAGAQVDVFRTDLPGSFPTKTGKRGVFVYAGLPFVGRYIIAASMPNAAPNFIAGVRVGQDIDYEVVLSPGDGRRLTEAEAKALVKPGGGGSTPTGGGGAKITPEEEAKRKAENERIAKENEKNYDEALKQYDTGLAADPEQPSLLTNKTLALKARGVDRYNAAILTKDEAAKTSGLELAKADFKAAADAANKAADIIKKMPAATDPEEQKQQTVNKYATMSARAEAMRLFVTKADGTQVDAGAAAFQDYIAVETDAAKKSRAQLDMAQMLLDAGAGDKAFAEFQKILAEKPDDPDANLGAGLALFSTGDKAKYQEAANYLQRFVDKAPDTHKFKNDAKAVLAELKSTENVVPEKTNAPPRRKRP